MFMGVVCIALFLIVWPLNYYFTTADIQRFNAVQETINRARERGAVMESAAFQLEIASENKWLAAQKFWNSTTFDMCIPDEVERLEPIE